MQPVLFEPVSADHTCELHTPTIPANHSVEVALSTAFGLSHKRKHTAEGVRLIVTQSRTSAFDVVVRPRHGHYTALFGPPSPDSVTRSEICVALEERLARAGTDRLGQGPLESNWCIDELITALTGFSRTDDGTDLFAFRLASPNSDRSIYIHLYGRRDLISFDLEDPTAGSDVWDYAVTRGAVSDVPHLVSMATAWLLEGGLPRQR